MPAGNTLPADRNNMNRIIEAIRKTRAHNAMLAKAAREISFDART